MKLPDIQSLRQKPKAARDRIALGVAGMVTALVFTVWVVADPAGITERITAVEETEQPRMFGGLIDQVREQIAGVRQAVEKETASTTAAATSSNQVVMPEMPQAIPPGSAPDAATTSTSVAEPPREIQLYIEPEATTSASMDLR